MLALSKSIPNGGPEIVHEDWVGASIKQGSAADESNYRPNSIPKVAIDRRQTSENNLQYIHFLRKHRGWWHY